MDIRISKSVARDIGFAVLKPWLKNEESWSWREEAHINLAGMGGKELAKFEKAMQENIHVRGVKVILKDIGTWRSALTDEDSAKPRAVRQFEPLLIRCLGKVEGHRLYKKYDTERDLWLAYYVEEIDYISERRDRNGGIDHPAHVIMKIVWEEFGGKRKDTIHFYNEDCVGISILEALARKDFYVETPDMRAKYLEQVRRFGTLVEQVGKQCFAVGTATDNLDGNTERRESWYWRRINHVAMERSGEPSRVVVDVFVEDESNRDRDREEHINSYFWLSQTNRQFIKARQNAINVEESEEIAEDNDIPEPALEVPIHPKLAVFDLKRHLRVRIHVDYLTEYVYDTKIAGKLVIPNEEKELVKLLINHSDTLFRDIVAGKSGGAVVLLTGKPGTGKTLTAEVYAESEKKALYSIQCSQLGTDPNELEDELLKVFARAKRWGAVMLLDEADVYVHERGNDLTQNAIVGVFLRVLEYQSTILFLTTNRPDDVDDAIASRCIARIDYKTPSAEYQKRIWSVLANASGIELSYKNIETIVAENPNITGRDVKNLLKLANLHLLESKEPITAKTIAFARKFKPTGARKSGG